MVPLVFVADYRKILINELSIFKRFQFCFIMIKTTLFILEKYVYTKFSLAWITLVWSINRITNLLNLKLSIKAKFNFMLNYIA